MFVVVNEKPAGLLGVADPIKESTPQAIAQLHAQNIRVVMLTGDSRTTAEAVAGYCWERLAAGLRGQGLRSLLVRVWESPQVYAARDEALEG